jgi:peptidoglycan-N-acetylglucosamine deacetylase
MEKDQLRTRRALIGGVAALAVAGAAGVFARGEGDEPVPPAVPAEALAAGPQASPTDPPSAFRLQPLAGYGGRPRVPRRTEVRHEPFRRLSGRGRTMVLTFDDGPDPRYTPQILDTLAQYEVRAMFFVCGEMAVRNQDLLARMSDEGHIVGNHTWSHPLLTSLPSSRVRAEMKRTSDVIEAGYGERPRWFRAPYGAWNRAVFQLGADMGMEPLAWTLDSLDWTTPGTRTIVHRVEDGAAPGVVVLSHDAGGNRAQSVGALRRYLPHLLDSGYHITLPRRRPT